MNSSIKLIDLLRKGRFLFCLIGFGFTKYRIFSGNLNHTCYLNSSFHLPKCDRSYNIDFLVFVLIVEVSQLFVVYKYLIVNYCYANCGTIKGFIELIINIGVFEKIYLKHL